MYEIVLNLTTYNKKIWCNGVPLLTSTFYVKDSDLIPTCKTEADILLLNSLIQFTNFCQNLRILKFYT